MTNSRETNWATIPRDGGVLCLDFVNTVSDRTVDAPRDYLGSFADLVNWLDHTQALPPAVLARVGQSISPAEQEAAITLAREGRALLYRLFAAVAAGRPAPPDALETLNAWLSPALTHRRLARQDERYAWQWNWPDPLPAPALLWPVLWSAAEVLTTLPPERIKACPACGWLFYDQSKNGSRTWCSMAACGSASKARRYYQRKRGEKRHP